MPVADRSTFVELYAGQPRWEIGRPQKALLGVADRITGSVLDCGCGSGENALFLAGRGQKVTGIDFLAEPVKWAKQKAGERRASTPRQCARCRGRSCSPGVTARVCRCRGSSSPPVRKGCIPMR